jgi:hypothetical protein
MTDSKQPESEYKTNDRTYRLVKWAIIQPNKIAVAIYHSTYHGVTRSYETQILEYQLEKEVTFGKNKVTLKEKWNNPNNEDFGKLGWSHATFEAANRSFCQVMFGYGILNDYVHYVQSEIMLANGDIAGRN